MTSFQCHVRSADADQNLTLSRLWTSHCVTSYCLWLPLDECECFSLAHLQKHRNRYLKKNRVTIVFKNIPSRWRKSDFIFLNGGSFLPSFDSVAGVSFGLNGAAASHALLLLLPVAAVGSRSCCRSCTGSERLRIRGDGCRQSRSDVSFNQNQIVKYNRRLQIEHLNKPL